MSARKKRVFSLEFKKKVVQEVESQVLSGTAACRKYEISYALLQSWKEKFRTGVLAATPSRRERELERELDRYKTLLAEAVAEREFLKKIKEMERRKELVRSSVLSGLSISPSAKGSSS